MVFINAIFTIFSLLWLFSQIADAELDPELWFALAFTLLCAANTVNSLGDGRRRHGRVKSTGEPLVGDGEPRAERPDVPAAYGVLDADAGDGLAAWPEVGQRLAKSMTYWVCTTQPDGRPHSVPVWGVWQNDTFYFGTHRQSRKARNIAASPYLSIHLDSSEEVVIVEGLAEEVGDAHTRANVDQAFSSKYDLEADAPAEDSSPIFSLRPKLAFAWSGSDFAASATRWTFGN